VSVTADHLRAVGACADQRRLFRQTFPRGGVWPDDLPRAIEAGLSVGWIAGNLGLLPIMIDALTVPEAVDGEQKRGAQP
jgi:hypothetical protein